MPKYAWDEVVSVVRNALGCLLHNSPAVVVRIMNEKE